MDEPIGNIYFADEHRSKDFQGFMNGALQSSNKTVRAIIEVLSKEKVLN